MDWFLGGFRALGAAIARPAEWTRLSSAKGLKSDSSLADLSAEFGALTLALVMFLFRLGAACILTVALQGVLAIGAASLLGPEVSWMEVLRPFLLVGGAALGFGAVVACALGVRAGAALAVLAPACTLPVLVLAIAQPGLEIGGIRVFTATGSLRDLSYSMGGFSIGAALALAERYLHVDAVAASTHPSPRGHAVLLNLLLSLVLLVGYAWSGYRILQLIDGRENAKWPAVLFLLLPWLGVLYRQHQHNPVRTWKVYALSIVPLSVLVGGGVSIAATVFEDWSPGPDHWVDRLGVGLMAGALLAGTLVFLSALVAPLFPQADQRTWSGTVVNALIVISLVAAIALGAFEDLDRLNRAYMISGGISGLLSVWILSEARLPALRILLRAGVCVFFFGSAALQGQAAPSALANSIPSATDYTGQFALNGSCKAHPVAGYLWFDTGSIESSRRASRTWFL